MRDWLVSNGYLKSDAKKSREELDVLNDEDCVGVFEVLVDVLGALDDEDCEEGVEVPVDELGVLNGEGDGG